MSEHTATVPRRASEVTHWDFETDVLVVGFGATGACAAIEAAEAGADTLVLESRWRGGGTRRLTSLRLDHQQKNIFRAFPACAQA